ncbi:unnamed protein product [Oreochromis niloticus]|nr:unnamed protein product [Mustela putorius furo]
MIFHFFIAFLPAVRLQDYKDFQDPCPISSCNPQVGDLLVGRAAQLSASSTCGLDGPQNYCIIGYLEEGQKCFICDSQLPYHRYNSPNSHRIENVITNFDLERKLKWWQSENGVHHVSIQLNLETMFQFSHLVLTFKSFRPAAMLVERSKDFGRSWKVVRYFAEDCSLHFPSVSTAPARSIDDVVCDSRYSGSEPSSDGEVVLKALDPVFKTENPHAPNIQDLTTVTNIRVNFTRLFTLGDTLLSRRRRNPQDKYYYSVYNMVVQGSCFCNGHASQCVPMAGVRWDIFTQPGMVHGQCVCQHNTAGENCERCQDFHHDSPWRPGGEGAADICRACKCHGHSDSCHFDAARYKATGGVSGGVCDDCGNNRMGPQCEQCRPFLYQDLQRAKDDPHACIPCNCDPVGSRDGGQCDSLSGQCVCKENVEGQRCDRCKHGFFSLRQDDPAGCQACRCHPLGSVGSCDQLTGTCECDQMASGPLCDQCLPGFWGLGNSVFRCSPCNCDIGGAQGHTCSPEDGQCRCLPNMIGRRCSDPAPGYFLPPLNYFFYEAELTFPLLGGNSSTTSPPPSPSSSAAPSSSSLVCNRTIQPLPVIWHCPSLPEISNNSSESTTISGLNDYRLIALTSVVAKFFKKLVLKHIKDCITPSFDPHQFAYKANTSTEDAISTALHSALHHLENPGTFVRMLISDFSSAFNTIISDILIAKLRSSTQHWLTTGMCATLMGLITDDDDTAYRDEIQRDYVERVSSFKFLSTHISEDLYWTTNTSALVKKAQQHLHFLRVLRWNRLQSDLLFSFYRTTIDSVLVHAIPVWYAGCTTANKKRLQRVIRTAEKMIGCPLSTLDSIASSRCLSRAGAIIKDRLHPNHHLFNILPSGKRFRSIRYKTNRLKSSFFPWLNPGVLPQCEQYFKEQGFDTKFQNGRVILVRQAQQLAQRQKRRKRLQQTSIPLVPGYTLQIIPRQRAYHQPVTWTGLGLVRVFEGVGLRFTVDNLPSSTDYQLVISYELESASDWMALVSIIKVSQGDDGCSSSPTGSKTLILPGNSRRGILDSLLCLNAGGHYFVDITFYKQPRSDGSHILIDSISLFNRIGSVQNFCSQSDLDTFHQFHCTGLTVKLGPQESLPEVCEGLIMSLSAQIHNGAVLCRCNVIGSIGPSCSKLGGFCQCKANVIGRCCDACAPVTFGFGPEGCKRCDCDPHGSVSELCDQVSGQCACRSETAGQRCDRCQMGFWGFPSCRSCECNGLSEMCDGLTGDCLSCREHTTGPSCERCVEGYYGDPISRQACQLCLCPDVLSSGRFFATSCQHDPQSLRLICNCQEGHTGVSCDRCSPGFYGDLTLPGAVCKECPCNNNINPDDPNSCNSTTGECLHCLHNTIGLHCQNCKPGYYGNALTQDCKECSCDRRGTQVTRCPLGRPCFCDLRTGQCPCRTGVIGKLCDECEDRYWNLNIASGCQPCSCDPVNSISNICDKVTGRCPCHPEFGGRHCDECRENHFRNPDLQCIPCDCNPEGTKRPSCDPETSECICRAGVTGIFCDECAPGFNTLFPACEQCHPCNALWTQIVTDVQQAAQKITTLIPHNNMQPTDNHYLQEMMNMRSVMDSLANLRVISPPSVEKLEKMSLKVRKVKDAIDAKVILIDVSPLFNTEIDNIHLEIMNLEKKLTSVPTDDINDRQKARVSSEPVVELLDEIQTLYKVFMLEHERVRNVSKAVEDSMDTRQEVKYKLSMCNTGDLALLKKKVTELSVVQLNQKVCGDPGLEDCSGCTGALCGRDLGNRKCGGPNCKGAVPVSEDASETAEKLKDQLVNLPSRLQDTRNKINNANQTTQDAKNRARDLQDRISNNTNSCEREKSKPRELIQQVKDYLMDDMVPPEDTEKIAQAVLRIQLPQSPANIQSIISNVGNLLKNATRLLEDLNNLDKKVKAARDLQQEARDLKEQMENTDVRKIIQDIYEADKAQDKANNLLERVSRNKDETKDRIRDAEVTLDNIEARLMIQTEDLWKEIEAMKDKTEENREAAREAREAAESAFNMTADAEMELNDVMKQFEVLKQKQQNQEVEGQAAGRLKNIMMEAEDMKRQVEDKLQQIRDMEQKIQQLLHRRNQKAAEVSDLLEAAESIRQEISTRAQVYTECTG